MRAELEGRGSGLGRYQGLTVIEIEALFAACRNDPSMRSVRSVLRITREQLDARGSLGGFPYLAIGLSVIALVALAMVLFGPRELLVTARMALIGFGTTAAATIYGVLNTRHERRANLVQEAEIRRLAADSLQEILAHEFPRKPLEREHIAILQELIKREPRERLDSLL